MSCLSLGKFVTVNSFLKIFRIYSPKTILKLFVMLILFLIAQSSFAVDDFIVDKAYFEDQSANLTLEEAKKKNFIKYDGFLAKGYTNSVFWLRLTIDPGKKPVQSSAGGDFLVMIIRPTNLDEIQVYDPLDSESFPYFLGDTVDVDTRQNNYYQSLNINKVILRGTESRYIWLRLKTTSVNLIDVRAYVPVDLYQFERKREYLYEFNIAYFSCFLIWSLYYFIFSRENIVGVFAVKQFFGLISTVLLYGYFRFLFGEGIPAVFLDKLNSVFFIIYGTISVFFDYVLLKELMSKRRMPKILLFLIGCFPLELFLIYSGYTMRALQLNMIITAIGPLFSFLIAISYKPDTLNASGTFFPYKILIFSYGLISILSMLFVLSVIGVLPCDEWVLNARVFQGFVAGILLMTVLQIRSHQIEQNRQLVMTQLELKQQELDIEWQHQEEKSQFLGILAHDLKTPLALIKMILGIKEFSEEHIKHLNNAVNDMNTVIERCLQVAELEETKLSLVLVKLNLLNLLNEIKRQSPGHRRININCDSGLWLKTDDQLLQIILSNLIDNANKYSDPHTAIDIIVSKVAHDNSDGIEILIANMPGKNGWPDPEKVFQKYYRGNNQQRLSGSGQGLYLVANLAKILGGNIIYRPYKTHIGFVLWLPNNLS